MLEILAIRLFGISSSWLTFTPIFHLSNFGLHSKSSIVYYKETEVETVNV